MVATTLPLILAGMAQLLAAPGVERFPGPGFDQPARSALERRALTVWPGPSGLLALWQTGALTDSEQVALLLGGAAFRDRQLLPAYLEGIARESPRVRAAALYGYRALLADEAPDPATEVSAQLALATAQEMREVAATLSRHSLGEMWLAALLANGAVALPRFSGVVLERPPSVCYSALDRVLWPEDLEVVVAAYALVDDPLLLGPMVPLVEALALERFPVRAWNANRRWSRQIHDEADRALRGWLEARCDSGSLQPAAGRLAGYAPVPAHPLSAGACEAWQEVLVRGSPSWWPTAVRQLYRCGGPEAYMPILRGDGAATRAERAALLAWFGLSDPAERRRR